MVLVFLDEQEQWWWYLEAQPEQKSTKDTRLDGRRTSHILVPISFGVGIPVCMTALIGRGDQARVQLQKSSEVLECYLKLEELGV